MRRLLFLALLALPCTAQQRPAITGVAFMRVYTTDAAGANAFYGKTLGYNRIEAEGKWIYPVNGLQWVEVLPNEKPPQALVRQAAVGFMTRDAAGLERYLTAHGVAVVDALHDGEFSVRDPEGNLVYFVQSGARAQRIAKMVAAAKPSANAASRRIIHVGFVVHDRAKEDAFYRGLLGFRPYWHGGPVAGEDYYQSQQVPDGTDWLEYMLHSSSPPTLKETGSHDHMALGVAHIQDALRQLEANGCREDVCRAIRVGNDGKIQLNLFDPDGTRAEFMEFVPVLTPRSSPILGKAPGPEEDR